MAVVALVAVACKCDVRRERVQYRHLVYAMEAHRLLHGLEVLELDCCNQQGGSSCVMRTSSSLAVCLPDNAHNLLLDMRVSSNPRCSGLCKTTCWAAADEEVDGALASAPAASSPAAVDANGTTGAPVCTSDRGLVTCGYARICYWMQLVAAGLWNGADWARTEEHVEKVQGRGQAVHCSAPRSRCVDRSLPL